MNFLLDVNVLMAITWPTHVAHIKAQSWFVESGKSGWVTSPGTESGFIRLSSNPVVVSEVVTPNACAVVLESLKKVGNYRFVADGVPLSQEMARSEVALTGHRQVSDTHLALVAQMHNCVFATFDSGAAELAQRLGAESLLIETW
jgi:toxin-antitoxin system PIN domain toxin